MREQMAMEDRADAPAIPSALKLRFVFEAQETITAPQAFGAMVRGALGAALRRVDRGTYARLFEARGGGATAGYGDAPAPFALDTPASMDVAIAPGDSFSCALTLFGRGADDRDAIVAAMEVAGAAGLGKSRGRARLIDVAALWREDAAPETAPPERPKPPPAPEAVTVALTSPHRVLRGGAPMAPERFDPSAWLGVLRMRCALLAHLYDGADFAAPAPVGRMAIAQSQFWLRTQHAWSARQRRERDLSGVMGSFVLPLTGRADLWPALWAAQWVQVGASTTAGLGCVRIFPA